MQYTGHVIVNGEMIRVLIRETKTIRYMKLRKSGNAGVYMSDESIHLNETPEQVAQLKAGKTIGL